MALTPERKVKNKLVAILKQYEAWYCFPVASGYGSSGIPDVLACLCGMFIGIECKAPGNSPTKLQQAQLDAIQLAGGYAVVYDGSPEANERLHAILRSIAFMD